MSAKEIVLQGRHVRLERLQLEHANALAAASGNDASLYQWSPVPKSDAEAVDYIRTALAWKAAGTAVPFAIVRLKGDVVIGSTRFWNLEHWSWPEDHARHGRQVPDACEIGYTWLARPEIRTAANTEAKLLLLTHAFETWQVFRVCLHTDSRNVRSRAAIERVGGRFEGILRAHRMAADFIPRDSVRYSIVQAEWPEVKQRLHRLLERT